MTLRTSTVVILLILVVGCAHVRVVRIPLASTGLFVEIQKMHAHAFLAEYDFKLHLVESGRRVASVDMTGDSGGLSRIDVFRLDADTWAFQDHARTFSVNVKDRTIKDAYSCKDVEGHAITECSFKVEGSRIGYVDFDKSKRWRYISGALEGE